MEIRILNMKITKINANNDSEVDYCFEWRDEGRPPLTFNDKTYFEGYGTKSDSEIKDALFERILKSIDEGTITDEYWKLALKAVEEKDKM